MKTRGRAPHKVRLMVAGQTMVLAADTPYDRQLLVDHVAALIRRYGAVRLNAGPWSRWLTLTEGVLAAKCGHCLRPLERGVRQTDGDLMCVTCASRRAVGAQPERHRSAA